ncbi:MAG: AsmA-like C-terminal region-containing protein, partial [Pseudomonadota bacterium]
SLSGTAGGTTLTLAAAGAAPGSGWLSRPANIDLTAQNDDGAELVRQLGIAVTGEAAPGSLSVALTGPPREGMVGRIDFDALGIDLAFDGAVALDRGVVPTGTLSLSIDSLAPLSAALARPIAPIAPLTVEAELAGTDGGAVRAAPLSGTAVGVAFTGDVSATPTGLTGTLALDEADMAALTTLILGENAWQNSAETPWPSAAFAPSLTPEYDLSLAVSADRLHVGPYALEGANFDLGLSDGRLVVGNAAGMLPGDGSTAGGIMAGSLDLTRDGPRVGVSGKLAIQDAPLGPLVWQQDDKPVANGRLNLTADIAASGVTVSDLVANLSGSGDLQIDTGRVEGFNPARYDPAADLLGEARATPNESTTQAAVEAHLAAGDLAFERLEADLSLTGGLMRIEDVRVSPTLDARVQGTAIDLAAGTLRSDWTLALGGSAEGAARVGLTFDGLLAAPLRSLDTSALTAWLNLRQLEMQIQSVEEQNEALEAEADAVAPPLPADPERGTESPGEPDPAIPAPPEGTEDADNASPPARLPVPQAPPSRQDGNLRGLDRWPSFAHRRHARAHDLPLRFSGPRAPSEAAPL